MKIQGKLHAKFDTQQKTPTFRVREFVVEYADNPMYPQYLKFQLSKDRCEIIDSYEVGAQLDVEFDLRGRQWTNNEGKVMYFNSLEAWRVNPVQQNAAAGSQVPPPPPPPEAMDIAQMEDDDLPF